MAITLTELAPGPFSSNTNVRLVDINMFAKFDEIPSLPVQDIKEKPKCRRQRITKGNNSNRIGTSPYFSITNVHSRGYQEGARDLAFCLKVPHDSLLVWASSGGSGETARMRRLTWTFAARIGDKYQIRLTRSI